MIVLDTSALIAILLREPLGAACRAVLEEEGRMPLISAGTLAEVLIVAGQRGFASQMSGLLAVLDARTVPVTARFAHQAAQAYGRWGKGVHPARLNLGDCFAYALAKENACPLLYVGNDFWQTDIVSALADPRTAP
ncbi:type II toxin-antitoxin system VapC family toxin [Segnochrobactraceae bacterium EtOH-i3]